MLKTTIKIAYLCTHDYCVDIGKANHVFYNLESMIQKWKVGPTFSEGDHIFRKNWSAGTIFTGTNIPVTRLLQGLRSTVVDNIRRRIVGVMFPPSIFEDRCVNFRRSMIYVSTFEDRCVALRRSMLPFEDRCHDVSTFEDRCVDFRRSMC